MPLAPLKLAGDPQPPIRSEGGIYRMLTARAASNTTMVSEISDCSIIRPLAQRATGAVSVGEKAVLVLNAMNK